MTNEEKTTPKPTPEPTPEPAPKPEPMNGNDATSDMEQAVEKSDPEVTKEMGFK